MRTPISAVLIGASRSGLRWTPSLFRHSKLSSRYLGPCDKMLVSSEEACRVDKALRFAKPGGIAFGPIHRFSFWQASINNHYSRASSNRGRSSAVERPLHTRKVLGSKPSGRREVCFCVNVHSTCSVFAGWIDSHVELTIGKGGSCCGTDHHTYEQVFRGLRRTQ